MISANNSQRRAYEAFRISLVWSIVIGVAMVLGMVLFSSQIAALFLEQGTAAYEIASSGLPLFSIGFIPLAINLITIGYFQSVEKINKAMTVIILRGIIFIPLFFYIMPHIWSQSGGWLALPAAEIATNICLIFIYRKSSK